MEQAVKLALAVVEAEEAVPEEAPEAAVAIVCKVEKAVRADYGALAAAVPAAASDPMTKDRGADALPAADSDAPN